MTTADEDRDLELLRRAFSLARQARGAGHRPFGAVVATSGEIIAEAGSTQVAEGDPTRHAEMNAVRTSMKRAPRSKLRDATLYASSEPCAMCAAAAFYSGIGRIFFGFSETNLRPLRNLTFQGAGLDLSTRETLSRAPAGIAVIGPCLEAEAAGVHAGYWHEPGIFAGEGEHTDKPASSYIDGVLLDRDKAFLRRSFSLAEDAGARGELPFGALVAAFGDKVLIEAVSTEVSEGDWTCHAEMNAIRAVSEKVPRAALSTATIYASSEPCVMCSVAIFYSGVRRIVFGFSEPRLRLLLGNAAETVGLELSCREVLAHAPAAFEIHGPCIEDEAGAPHARYWPKTLHGYPE